ncbi:MAG: PorV/PorQ family protein [Candidatus Marinimicrobia bacterium]|nr:PorV/PorQ family protein [Candidatus Neomarinimicrobiota bacterium]
MRVFRLMKIAATLYCFLIIFSVKIYTQEHSDRVGTTAANFLEIGIGGAGNAMGEAYVSVTRDLYSIYWNPAGLAFLRQNEVSFMYQPWIVDINTAFAGVAIVLPRIGTLSLGYYHVGYGEMEVTTLEKQDGTGELFTANDYSISLCFSRKLAQWFAFGASGKFISSQIWHTSANAMAVDLGVIVSTHFFSPTGNRTEGMNIGMSISNYGTRLKYDGIDLLNPIDILPYEEGNYRDVEGQFRLQSWELPLIFRIGCSITPIVMINHRLTIAADALHPNNNSESVNLGAQYELRIPGTGSFFLRCGYKALFMDRSEYGLTVGGGLVMRMMHNFGFKVDYAFKNIGILGNVHSYTFGFLF